jgi:Lipase (class 3)
MSSEAFDDKSKKESSFNLFEGWKRGEKGNNSFFRDNLKEPVKENEENGIEQVLSEDEEKKNADHNKGGWSGWVDTLQKLTGSNVDNGKSVQALVEKARSFHPSREGSNATSDGDVNLDKLQDEIKLAVYQISASFGDGMIDMKLLNPISFNYYLEKDESIKTPRWKRRRHRFLDEVDAKTMYGLHDALYLAEASYLDSVEEIGKAVAAFQGDPYEMIYCSCEAQPRQPAHYIAIKKSAPKRTGPFPWQNENVLELVLVVRGTKEIYDMLADCMLESREYDGGLAHDGVCQSGLFLVEKHTEFLEHLLDESGRGCIRLSLIGHSLGAGAASIACIEFNKHPKIEAKCIGFGCPALLSKKLSEAQTSTITTVVSDADCVPRMSKATVSNLILDVMANDWTEQAMGDVRELLNVLKINIPFQIPNNKLKDAIGWVQDYLNNDTKPCIAKVTKERSVVELFPPGKIIHMFRDGVGVSVHYVNCDFFDQFDVCRTMVGDHLVPTGYNRLLHDFIRQQTKDSRFFFRNDVNALRAERHRNSTTGLGNKDE